MGLTNEIPEIEGMDHYKNSQQLLIQSAFTVCCGSKRTQSHIKLQISQKLFILLLCYYHLKILDSAQVHHYTHIDSFSFVYTSK